MSPSSSSSPPPAAKRPGRGFFIGLAALLGVGVFVVTQAAVTTDLARFLPTGDAQDQAALMREFATSELSRTMLLLVEAPTPEAALTASRDFEKALRAQPGVALQLAFLEGGTPAGLDRAFWELYHPRRLAFLATSAKEAGRLLTAESLTRSAEGLKERLSLPLSPLLTRAAPTDPLMIVPGMFDRLQPTRASRLKLSDGRFVTADERHAVLFLGSKASAFNSTAQGPLLDGVQAAFAQVNEAAGGTLKLQQSGVNRIAVAAEGAIKRDIKRVSIVSVLSVIVLFMLLFGSLRLVAVTMVPITAGMLTGTAGCLVLFGAIHGLTLAFGAALIGVCIDYVAHTYCHYLLEPDNGGSQGTIRRVWSGLALGAATTILGFIALGGATFPGLQEVGVFGALGVSAALAATRWLVPPLMGANANAAKPRLRRLAQVLEGALAAGRRKPLFLWALPVACAVVVALGLPKMDWNDDLSEFGRVEGPLMDEDAAVRAQVAPFEQRRFIVSAGVDDEAALQGNDAVARRLAAAREAGEIGGFRTMATLLPSAAQQNAVMGRALEDKQLWSRLEKAFAGVGFNPAAFEPFRKMLGEPAPRPLVRDDIMASPVASLVRPFRITLGERVGYVSFLNDVKDAPALGKRLDGITGVTLLDFGAVISTAYGGYRQRMVELLLLGLLAVVIMLGVRYRDVRLTVAALAPSLLAAATTLAVLALAEIPLSVLTVTSLLMVVCIGVDYGVFLAETARGGVDLAPTLAAMVVAAVSTLFGFGLLSLSDHPALMSLGLTAALGVGLSVLLAPTALVLVGRSDVAG